MKIKSFVCICLMCFLLSGCARVVNSPKDEIRLFDWSEEFENGNAVSLSFSDSYADFSVKNPDYTLNISGLCSITDDSIVILNEEDTISYKFTYILHGDSLELFYRGDGVTLAKNIEK